MTKSDLVLFAYIVFLVPLMLVGFGYARRKKFVPHHKMVMTTVTIINWILILFIMAATYLRDVAPQVQHLNYSLVFIPSLHLIVGGIAQLLATYLVLRMWFERQLPDWIKVKRIKPYMRVTLALWLLTAVLGLTTWAVFYHNFLVSPQTANASAAVPVANTVNLVSGQQFQPASLTVPTGTTVHFINNDAIGHTVTADDNSFDSGELAPGKSFDFTFNQPGDIAYYCAFHGGPDGSGMSGVIHVTGNAVKVATQPATPAATQPATPAATQPATPAATLSSVTAIPAATTAVANDVTDGVATIAANSAQNVVVSLTDNVFSPSTLTITIGTTIHFVNNGKRSHTATADDGSFDSGQLKAGQTFDQTFKQPGDVQIYCQNHGDKGGKGMAMLIHVTAASPTNSVTVVPTSAATVQSTTSLSTLSPTLVVATAPATTVSSSISPTIIAAVKPLVIGADDTPGKHSYLAGVKSQMALITVQQVALLDALQKGHIEDAQAAAEAILNVINGGAGTDLDKNGSINQPGDGFGLKTYIFNTNDTANTAATTLGLPDLMRQGLTDLQVSGRAALTALSDLGTQLQTLIAATSLVKAQALVPVIGSDLNSLNQATGTMGLAGIAVAIPGNELTQK